ncbi:hypothetical protein ACHAPU_008748 [Fusarium lateritium]
MAQESHVPIYWLNVECDSDTLEQRLCTLEQRLCTLEQRLCTLEQRLCTLEQRLCTPERQQGSKTKLTDVHILRGLLERHELIDPTAICGENSGTRLVFEQLDATLIFNERSKTLIHDLLSNCLQYTHFFKKANGSFNRNSSVLFCKSADPNLDPVLPVYEKFIAYGEAEAGKK